MVNGQNSVRIVDVTCVPLLNSRNPQKSPMMTEKIKSLIAAIMESSFFEQTLDRYFL